MGSFNLYIHDRRFTEAGWMCALARSADQAFDIAKGVLVESSQHVAVDVHDEDGEFVQRFER